MKSILLAITVLSAAVLPHVCNADESSAERDLRLTEIAFAKTMANRDLDAFAGFLSQEVVFFNGESTLRGPDAVVAVWSRYFDGEHPLFSWEPEAVAVLESGSLGFSSGPVLDPSGKRIGTFNSVWRKAADGKWQIIFDRGCPDCDGP